MAIQQDSQSTDTPPLPPRRSESNAFSDCAKTPPVWIIALTRHNAGEDHTHDFLLSRFDEENVTRLICKDCHKRFMLNTSFPSASSSSPDGGGRGGGGGGGDFDILYFDKGICTANIEHKIHHLHTTSVNKSSIHSYCCLCLLDINVEIMEPIIDISIFEEMAKTRKPRPLWSHAVKSKTNGSSQEPTIYFSETLEVLKSILENFLNNNSQLKNVKVGDKFISKIGYDDASQAFFEKLGYTLDSNDSVMLFRPPPLDEKSNFDFKHVLEELELQYIELSNINSQFIVPWDKLCHVLGTKYKPRSSNLSSGVFDPKLTHASSRCHALGCLPEMDDAILIDSYNILVRENPEKNPEYLQSVCEIYEERKSYSLGELVGLERSKGKFSLSDIDEAYRDMEAQHSVSDEQLIEAFQTYYNEHPHTSGKMREALSTIGKARNSSRIENFLKERTNELNMFDYFSDMPVGLDNIGNTCYLNSLLQYYFTIKKLREAVFATDSTPTNGFYNEWELTTIGGRGVTKAEVERAQKFVNLLRNLFVELMHTSQRSISPDFDLAYLALVNAKSEEDHTKESSRSPMDTVMENNNNNNTNSVNMIIDDNNINTITSPEPSSSPPPLSSNDNNNNDNDNDNNNNSTPDLIDLTGDGIDDVINVDAIVSGDDDDGGGGGGGDSSVNNNNIDNNNNNNNNDINNNLNNSNNNNLNDDDDDIIEINPESMNSTVLQPNISYDDNNNNNNDNDDNMDTDTDLLPLTTITIDDGDDDVDDAVTTDDVAASTSATMSIMSTDATTTIMSTDATTTADLFNSNSSSKGKEKEDTATTTIVSQQPQGESDSYTKEDKLKQASGMLFGKQQDVTECMDNVMFQLEAALKSIMTNENGEDQNIVKSLFYGKSLVAEGRDLYDGLDVYFDASTVDFNGAQAEREVTLITSPPILQIQVQRVQFDRSTSNIYKSNAYLRFEKAIYLDRYLDKNREILRNLIKEAHERRQEIDTLQEELKEFSRDKTTFLPTAELLKSSAEFVQSLKNEDSQFIMDENFGWRLEQESDWVVEKINEYEGRINSLRYELGQQYNHLTECKYLLHAVFIHSGQANFGHYWIYIYDFEKNRWLKYNDSYVTEVDEYEVFADTTGSSANPYCMVYVREQDDQLVETVCRKPNIQ
ncbi:hypothetical protein Glove_48g70 [Diversispora epigaea]|uniref:ubiquitinyl hydrolase 1 n=1 Tax=Diversispora epigaea TaxID=1348612 RepID=A0A397JKU5_9GLOM|nr:hypothetical protein Glove_48g70 [Diversispora epigaea]